MLGGGGPPVAARGPDKLEKGGGVSMSTRMTDEHSMVERALRRGATTSDRGHDPAAEAARRLAQRAVAEGLADVVYAPVDSPFGELLLAATGRGLVRLAFPEENVDSVLERISQRVSPRIVEAPGRLEGA